MMIQIYSDDELAHLRDAGRLLATVLREVRAMCEPGVRLRALNRHAEKKIRALGGRPAFKGYQGFPATLCLSVNEEAVHGLPRWRRLREGDLVSVDCGVELNGFYADAAFTAAVGRASEETLALIAHTKEALEAGLAAVRPGARVGDIGAAIEAVASRHSLGVVEHYCGHGIGRQLHEDPQVPNWGAPGQGPVLQPGWCLAIEPLLTQGGAEVLTLSDGWTISTADGSRAAHFEMMVCCTEDGHELLSLTEDGQWP